MGLLVLFVKTQPAAAVVVVVAAAEFDLGSVQHPQSSMRSRPWGLLEHSIQYESAFALRVVLDLYGSPHSVVVIRGAKEV